MSLIVAEQHQLDEQHQLNEFDEFIDAEIASGRFRSREEVIHAGLKLLRDRNSEEAELRTALQAGLDDIGRGDYVTLSTEAEKQQFFAELIDDARRELVAR